MGSSRYLARREADSSRCSELERLVKGFDSELETKAVGADALWDGPLRVVS